MARSSTRPSPADVSVAHAPQPGGNASTRPATERGTRRREAIVEAAAQLFARHGYPAVGMDEIGAAAGVTGPAIYRHFDSKAAVLAAVIDAIIDAVAPPTAPRRAADRDCSGPLHPAHLLTAHIEHYATGVAQRRELMAIFVREVHHLPDPFRDRLRDRQRTLVTQWRALLAAARPDYSTEHVRTSINAVFGILNSVATFHSPLPDRDLAAQLVRLATAALDLPTRVTAR